MTSDALKTLIQRFLSCPMPLHNFGWQGGEPTLMGVDFFRKAVCLQKEFAPPGAHIANALQTNGTLLDNNWGRFLKDHHFLVGVSLDGPAQIHNAQRSESHAAALNGYKTLQHHGVDTNILTLVSAANQNHPEEVYQYLCEVGAKYHQYIECVETDNQGCRQPFAVAPGKWGEFLCRVFDIWYPRDIHTVSIRLFDSIVSRLATGRPTMCSMDGRCSGYLVIEHNGDVFPCDFHVTPSLRLGNIHENDFYTLRTNRCYQQWADGKNPHSEKCSACRYLPLCMGDCPKNRRNKASLLCEDWRMFYSHTISRFEQLVTHLTVTPVSPTQRPKPNEQCPCGSGRKFKKCCGRK